MINRRIFGVGFLVIVFSSFLSAQEFGSPDCHWVYNRSYYNGFTEVVFEKDTLIDNKLYNKFDFKELWVFSGDTMVVSFDHLFLNNSDGLVMYSLNATEFDTLINYKAIPGDSWKVIDRILESSFIINVLDTFTSTFRGVDYRALSYIIHEENGFIGNFRDTIYEQWGFRHNFILPFDGANRRRGGTLLCFSNDVLGTIEVGIEPSFVYANVYDYDCNVTTAIDEIGALDIDFTLSPNPVVDRLTVSGVGFGSSYAVHSVSGELRMRGELSYDSRIDVTYLPVGLYFLEIYGVVRKFVKVE